MLILTLSFVNMSLPHALRGLMSLNLAGTNPGPLTWYRPLP